MPEGFFDKKFEKDDAHFLAQCVYFLGDFPEFFDWFVKTLELPEVTRTLPDLTMRYLEGRIFFDGILAHQKIVHGCYPDPDTPEEDQLYEFFSKNMKNLKKWESMAIHKLWEFLHKRDIFLDKDAVDVRVKDVLPKTMIIPHVVEISLEKYKSPVFARNWKTDRLEFPKNGKFHRRLARAVETNDPKDLKKLEKILEKINDS